MMPFEHNYYHAPAKKGEPATVLCMRCALKIKGVGISKEETNSRYKEKEVSWITRGGLKGKGILILCPSCVDLPIEDKEFTLIHRQVMQALEDEAKWAKLPVKSDLKDMRITNQEAA